MKKILLVIFCLLALLLSGCTSVVQSNSFSDDILPHDTEETAQTEVQETLEPVAVEETEAGDDTAATPTAQPTTEVTVPDNVQPADTQSETDEDTTTDEVTPTETPDSNPGFNG